MTQEKLNQTIFYVQNGEIQKDTYRGYLNDFGKDLCTSPRGVADRMHIREVKEYLMKNVETGAEIWESEYKELEEDEQEKYNYLGEDVKEWQIWSWGVNGNNPHYTGPTFDKEEDAELYYYERSEWYVQEKNNNAPIVYNSIEEAEEEIIQSIKDGEGIDFDVAKSIYAKIKKVAVRRAELKAIAAAEYQKRKEEKDAAVPGEAAAIDIDEEFEEGIKAMANMSGKSKSEYADKIFNDLLKRKGIPFIKSDYWKVFRILKTRAEE